MPEEDRRVERHRVHVFGTGGEDLAQSKSQKVVSDKSAANASGSTTYLAAPSELRRLCLSLSRRLQSERWRTVS